jgi:uncharacterized protein YjbI with pentapeptide repeats
MDLLDLLVNGKVEEFNTTRSRRGVLELFGADLSGARLAGVDLSGANLEKADLSNADLTDAIFARTNLSGADLSNARLSGAMAIKSIWREAFMGGVEVKDADFSGADLTDAEITDAVIANTNFTGAKLKRTDFTGSTLAGVDLTEAKLPDCKLVRADLQNAILRAASLVKADFSGAKMSGADLSQARMEGAVLKGADLTRAKLGGADLSGADLTGAVLCFADLTRADLSEAVLTGVNAKGAVITDAQLDGTLEGAVQGGAAAPPVVCIEEPTLAIGPRAVALLWDNPEGEGRTVVRLMIGRLGSRYEGVPMALPVPADLVVARAMCATPDGFAVLVLVDRPGGVVGTLLNVSEEGVLLSNRKIKVPYTPGARPILQHGPDGLVLYGISREGPGLQVHRIDGETVGLLYNTAMPTLRGFVSDHHPLVLSKGGVIFELGTKGGKSPMGAPANFPGRRCGSAPLGDKMFVAWLSATSHGLFVSALEPNEKPDELQLHKKLPIGTLDVVSFEGRVTVAFTQEPKRTGGSASAWAMSWPRTEPIPLVTDPNRDITEVRLAIGVDGVYAAAIEPEGGVELFLIVEGTATSRFRFEV